MTFVEFKAIFLWRVANHHCKNVLSYLGPAELQLIGIKLLPFLLPAPGIVNGRKAVNKWKPSKPEALAGIILEVKSMGDFEKELKDRQDKLTAYGLQNQPITVIVSTNETIVSYVIIEDTQLIVPTPLLALDCTFKSFFTFNLEYPPESRAVYSFLQKYVYKLPMEEGKRTVTRSEALAVDLGL